MGFGINGALRLRVLTNYLAFSFSQASKSIPRWGDEELDKRDGVKWRFNDTLMTAL